MWGKNQPAASRDGLVGICMQLYAYNINMYVYIKLPSSLEFERVVLPTENEDHDAKEPGANCASVQMGPLDRSENAVGFQHVQPLKASTCRIPGPAAQPSHVPKRRR